MGEYYGIIWENRLQLLLRLKEILEMYKKEESEKKI